jgi:hypothetical protein
MDQDQVQPNDQSRDDSASSTAVQTMSPEVRGVLRRRLLTGGAAALPVIATFGRRSWAQNGFDLSNCFSRTFNASAGEVFGAGDPDHPTQISRDELIGGIAPEGLVTGEFELEGQTFVVNNLADGDTASAMESLVLSAGAGNITYQVRPVLDESGNPVVLLDPDNDNKPILDANGDPIPVNRIITFAADEFDQNGCLASAGIRVQIDEFPV